MNFTDPRDGAARVSPWILFGLAAIALVAVGRSQMGWVVVVGQSMNPTFESGDVLLVNKRAYKESEPERDDIVVARFLDEYIVKRVVGLPGEVVEVKAGVLHVNHKPVMENHAVQGDDLDVLPGAISGGRYALLGDNRGDPEGLLFYAVLPRERLMGKVVARLSIPEWVRPRTVSPSDANAYSANVASPNTLGLPFRHDLSGMRESLEGNPGGVHHGGHLRWRVWRSMVR